MENLITIPHCQIRLKIQQKYRSKKVKSISLRHKYVIAHFPSSCRQLVLLCYRNLASVLILVPLHGKVLYYVLWFRAKTMLSAYISISLWHIHINYCLTKKKVSLMVFPLNIFTKLRQNTKVPIMTIEIGCIIYTKSSFDLYI